jgi:hypothetical protein
MIVRSFLPGRHRQTNKPLVLRKYPTIAIGAVGGFMVGLTSVGAGSMILVLLLMVYPNLKNHQLVGTDLAQSIPLTMAATAGTLLFGHVEFALTLSIIIGSVPAVIVGSLISSKGTFQIVRPFIAGVVLLSGLKYVGLPIPALGVAAIFITAIVVVMTFRATRADKPELIDLELLHDDPFHALLPIVVAPER